MSLMSSDASYVIIAAGIRTWCPRSLTPSSSKAGRRDFSADGARFEFESGRAVCLARFSFARPADGGRSEVLRLPPWCAHSSEL